MNKIYIALFFILYFQYCSSIEVGEQIKLPDPEITGGMTLNEALNNRKSSRDFDETKKIDLQTLSQALWSCNGVNRPNGYRTTPSATSWFPLIIYAFLEDGVYRYEQKENMLTKVVDGDKRSKTGTQKEVVTKAAVNFIIFGDFKKKSSMDGDDEHKIRSIYLDTGHCTMGLSLFASAHNMKGVVRGMVHSEPLKELLGLNKEDYLFSLAFSLGY
jgi:nitroreductase